MISDIKTPAVKISAKDTKVFSKDTCDLNRTSMDAEQKLQHLHDQDTRIWHHRRSFLASAIQCEFCKLVWHWCQVWTEATPGISRQATPSIWVVQSLGRPCPTWTSEMVTATWIDPRSRKNCINTRIVPLFHLQTQATVRHCNDLTSPAGFDNTSGVVFGFWVMGQSTQIEIAQLTAL